MDTVDYLLGCLMIIAAFPCISAIGYFQDLNSWPHGHKATALPLFANFPFTKYLSWPSTWTGATFTLSIPDLMVILLSDGGVCLCSYIGMLKDRRRRPEGGEWESIKIPHRNLAYVPKSTRNPSLLTRSRPPSYRQAIGLRNRARNCNESTERC
jgi:hypothetical protein